MMSKLVLALCLMINGVAVAKAQLADVHCDDSHRIEQRLERVMGAIRQGQGLRDPETILQVWVVPGSGEWTLVQTYANGTACIVAMGAHWQHFQGSDDPS